MWLIIVLQVAQPLPDTAAFDLAKIKKSHDLENLSVIARCSDSAITDEIVVCGARQDRYRLPLPVKRSSGERGRGEASTGTTALTPAAPCGIFEGQRRCSKKEAAQYGYGNGRDPITVLGRVAGKILNPDAN